MTTPNTDTQIGTAKPVDTSIEDSLINQLVQDYGKTRKGVILNDDLSIDASALEGMKAATHKSDNARRTIDSLTEYADLLGDDLMTSLLGSVGNSASKSMASMIRKPNHCYTLINGKAHIDMTLLDARVKKAVVSAGNRLKNDVEGATGDDSVDTAKQTRAHTILSSRTLLAAHLDGVRDRTRQSAYHQAAQAETLVNTATGQVQTQAMVSYLKKGLGSKGKAKQAARQAGKKAKQSQAKQATV